ncbi:unnamed protein product [Bemisia tabaci]|uniref:Dynein axonemal assembly factor 10 n=1 Tax=Bemisia tabaci TaxID=7038 RepID=A0A9P0A491_BEMTA|nr:PREDICTED: WD repeat-containing protein 92 [Bemisia tabaci]CAH0383633.1 unnamed protein product [Bemisia tabaci]
MDSPQIICHSEKSVKYSLFDCCWIPRSAKFVALGSDTQSNGVMQIYEVQNADPVMIKEVKSSKSFKCGTLGASSLQSRHLATGSFDGKLNIWDLEDPKHPIYTVDAHNEIINTIDGFGGTAIGCGAPEIVTGSRDGSVKVWDPRQKNKPVAVMECVNNEEKRDCWCVCFGNSYNTEERVVCAGYDNGDVKLFDLRKMSTQWECNVKNGVCCVEFDRKDIRMNKLVVTTLEAKFFVYDMTVQHPKKGFSRLSERAHKSTIWLCRHLPQNRDVFITAGGSGTLCLWKYDYPGKRFKEDSDGLKEGVMGTINLLRNVELSSQPISSFNWSPDKSGLAICTSFDQTLRMLIVTKLNTL